MKAKLYISQLEDPYLQQNFKTIGAVLNSIPFTKGQFRFVELEVLATGTDQRLEHRLPFIPSDIVVTSLIGGTITFKYESFDKTFLVFDATVTASPLRVRAIIGRYSEEGLSV